MPVSTDSSIKRTIVIILVGGATSLALVTWLFNRKNKSSKKSFSRSDSGIQIINSDDLQHSSTDSMAASIQCNNGSPPSHCAGRINYRHQEMNESELNMQQQLIAATIDDSWSEEVEKTDRMRKLNHKENNTVSPEMQQVMMQQQQDAIKGYKSVESPSVASMHSEVSADSGRATGGIASSMSPVEELCDAELFPMYEFEIPHSLVGLIIGIKGKTIKELSDRAEVKMIIRQHHAACRVNTHQICTVEGKRESINKCLQMLRRRFPPSRFPELNLKPILPPPIPSPATEMLGGAGQATPLTLPESVRCEVVVSSTVSAGHFFLQQPTHPSFASLQRLDYYMLGIYSQPQGIPEMPKPCDKGCLCVAPAMAGWYRAVTVEYYADGDEVLVKYVDYGGYSRISRSDLRQIRTDFMTLPFQACESYLYGVAPADGGPTWSEDATQMFQQLAMSKVIETRICGYHPQDGTPLVQLFTSDDMGQEIDISIRLVAEGLAKQVEAK